MKYAGFDPETDELVPLFNPRQELWTDHFAWENAVLVGKTPVGRATIDVLRINDPICVEHREFLIGAELFPPELSMSSK